MESNYIVIFDENGRPYLAHHGIKGQKWGVRRFQNPDMTWTEAGKERYGSSSGEHKSKDKKSGMSDETKKKLKTAAIVGGSLLAAGAAAYGAYKLNDIAVSSLKAEDMRKGLEYIKKRDKAFDDWRKDIAEGASFRKLADKAAGTPEAAHYSSRASERFRSAQLNTERQTLYTRKAEQHTERAATGAYSTQEKLKELRRLASRK